MAELTVTRDRHVARLHFSRPPHNHVTVDLIGAIADALEAVDADPALRASLLTSEGKAFSAGADFTAPSETGSGDFTRDLYAQALRIFSARKPMVAAIQGAAVGAGLGLAMVADFRVVAPEARFSANFVKLAFHPGFGLTHSLPRVIGQQRASWMFLTGARVKGEEALAWGLADQLVSLDRLDDAAAALAHEIAANAPLAVQATRATLRAGLADAIRATTGHEADQQAILRASNDFAEGVRAVNERRPGNFRGD